VTYQKEDLEGIIFGLNMDHKNAELVYVTVKKNFFDFGIPINFYKAVEVEHEYKLKIEPINDIEMYINELPKSIEQNILITCFRQVDIKIHLFFLLVLFFS